MAKILEGKFVKHELIAKEDRRDYLRNECRLEDFFHSYVDEDGDVPQLDSE